MASVKPTKLLKENAEVFYSKLSDKEAEITKKIVTSLDNYMESAVHSPYLIAGVGGILRYESSKKAEDIDLAVVGFKYTPGVLGRAKTHDFGHVESFTQSINDYFRSLQETFVSEGMKKQEIGFDWGSGHLHRGGSGPFSRLDERHELSLKGKQVATLESSLESFGWYNSKGLQVRFEGIRPIDVQFVFNQGPAEWETSQYFLTEVPTKTGRKGISERFPYAILAEGNN